MASTSNLSSGCEDSDEDVVTDYLNYNAPMVDASEFPFESPPQVQQTLASATAPTVTIESSKSIACTPLSVHKNNNVNTHRLPEADKNAKNTIPSINITSHSPAPTTKYDNIFGDTLSQLQSIRETVVKMKNCNIATYDGISNFGLLNAAMLSASLPDLNDANNSEPNNANNVPYVMWPTVPQNSLLSVDRRKSWTAADGDGDIPATGSAGIGTALKSASLSSLDSEEQATIRAAEQRRRAARNSTGGISTHSLNEAEFERLSTKRNFATELISRIPLHKSISTSSIVAKEDSNKVVGTRQLTDSEDENQSLLCAHHAKAEPYDNVEKRRKRGSLFFRKKKDKAAKMKTIVTQVSHFDVCGVNIPQNLLKEHQVDCCSKNKNKSAAVQKLMPLIGKREKSEGSGQDYLDGHDGHANHFADDTPLIRAEFINDAPTEMEELGADPYLNITTKEPETWTAGASKELCQSMKEAEIKRQENIYEFIMLEKNYCQMLLVMQKVFVESIERHFPFIDANRIFPRLSELSDLHMEFFRKLRQKQREQYAVESIADLLIELFSADQAQRLRLAYGEVCAENEMTLQYFRQSLNDQGFAEWYKHCLANPLLKKMDIPASISLISLRLTKYITVIDGLTKRSKDDKSECDKLQHSLSLLKSLVEDINARVNEKKLRERQLEIYGRLDSKTFAMYKNKQFRKADLSLESRRRLKFEGSATLMQGRGKTQHVMVVVLTDCLCFLTENSAHKYTFFTPEHKAGIVPLQKLLIREKAGTESRGIYIISSNPDFPEMYELKVQAPKYKHDWIRKIRQAVLESPSSDIIEAEDLTAEERLRIGINKREIIEKMRQKDIEQALLLEEKIMLQFNLLNDQQYPPNEHGVAKNLDAANFLAAFSSYKELVGVDCDTAELWKRVLNTVQNISQLASNIHMATTGSPVARNVVGDKPGEHSSPILPKRAETFAGFDEKRAKHGAFPCREVAKIATLQVLTPRLQELEEKRELKTTPKPVAQPTHSAKLSSGAVQEHNYAALQVSHHLNTLLCIISQQMTAIHSLQSQLALYRENPRSSSTHNDQLEELRNLQDKLQEEKIAWQRHKQQQEEELSEVRAQQLKLQEQVKAEQEDVKQQREQLYRKMELLSSQGLLLSPSTTLPIASPISACTVGDARDSHEDGVATGIVHTSTPTGTAPSIADRRKEKWRTASIVSNVPSANLLTSINAQKAKQLPIKQKLPMKLSSMSSTKVDKSASFTANTSHLMNVTQLLPLKLADKKTMVADAPAPAPALVPQHSRTGSSPAVIQQHSASPATSPTPISMPTSLPRAETTANFRNRKSTSTPTSTKTATNHPYNNSSGAQTAAAAIATKTAPFAQPEEEEEIYF